MKVLLVGAAGMLGSDWKKELETRGHQVTAPSIKELDITNRMLVQDLATRRLSDFDYVLNASGYTAVDKAESDVAAAMMVNAVGPGALAAVCQVRGWKLMHISTDFVFEGETSVPYKENAPTRPLSTYGASKLEGEGNVAAQNPGSVIVRTSWLYGSNGSCFPRTMMQKAKEGAALKVVNDQTGCPTSTVDLARALVGLMELKVAGGVYHACGPEATTWFELSVRTLALCRTKFGWPEAIDVSPCSTAEYPTPARRPRYSVLDTTKLQTLGLLPMRPMDESLAEFVGSVGPTL